MQGFALPPRRRFSSWSTFPWHGTLQAVQGRGAANSRQKYFLKKCRIQRE
jgi:hypothetical protein